MQQPLPVPDEYDGEGDSPSEAPPPRPSPEQLAEQSALEVFPGAATLGSDQWWQPPEPTEHDDEATAEPLDLPPAAAVPPITPTNVVEEWVETTPAEEPTADATTDQAPRQLWSVAEPHVAEPDVPDPGAAAPDAPEGRDSFAGPHPEAPPIEPPTAGASPTGDAGGVPTEGSLARVFDPAPAGARPEPVDEIPRSVLSLPLLSGREQREAAGASQREAIMAQAGALPDPLPDQQLSSADAQLAVAMQGPRAATAPAAEQSGGFTRKIRLSLIIIALTLVSLWGGAVATGQGGEVERGASALAPDVLEQWISDQVSSFGTSAPAATADAPIGAPSTGSDQSFVSQIAHTGGGGVPVRSTCVPEARTPRTINEGASVTIIAQGVGDCAGWNVVRAGATVSWVESAYLEPVAAP